MFVTTLYVTTKHTIEICKNNTIVQKLVGHKYPVNEVIYLGNNRIASRSDTIVRIWDLRNGSHFDLIHPNHVYRMCLLSDGRLVTFSDAYLDRAMVHVWDLQTQTSVDTIIALHGHPTILPNGLLLYTKARVLNTFVMNLNDQTKKIYRGKNGIQLVDGRIATISGGDIFVNGYKIFTTRGFNINQIIQLQDGRLAFGSSNSIIYVLNLNNPNAKQIRLIGGKSSVDDLVQLQNGYLVSQSIKHTYIWNLHTLFFQVIETTQLPNQYIPLLDGSLGIMFNKRIDIWKHGQMTRKTGKYYVCEFQTESDRVNMLYEIKPCVIRDLWKIVIQYL